MKVLLILVLITSHYCPLAQESDTSKIVRVGQVFTNGKLSFYFENDRNGNQIFTKNDGMNGPITMLHISEYDSLNRKTRTYFAHSNIGFSVSERVYDNNRILHYEYLSYPSNDDSYERDSLNKINSQREFLELRTIQSLLNSEKRLNKIEMLDSNKNIVSDIYISDQGDTSSINTREFNSNNKEILFRYGVKNQEPWVWDIYSIYDDNSNLIKSTRLSSEDGVKDTTEVYTYQYNSNNKLLSRSYHYKKDFKNRTEYIYDKNNKLIEEDFYEDEEFKLDVLVEYNYDKNGSLLKKTVRDFRESKKGNKEVFSYKFSYW